METVDNQVKERLDQLTHDIEYWTNEIKKEKSKSRDYRDEGYIEYCRENIGEFRGEINGINFMLGLSSIKVVGETPKLDIEAEAKLQRASIFTEVGYTGEFTNEIIEKGLIRMANYVQSKLTVPTPPLQVEITDIPTSEDDIRVKYALAVLDFLQKEIVVFKGDDPGYTITDRFILTDAGFYWNQDEDGDCPLDSKDLHRLFITCPEGIAQSKLNVSQPKVEITKEEILERVKEILKGIDSTELEQDGWWETSSGAKFGAEKLNELLEFLRLSGGEK